MSRSNKKQAKKRDWHKRQERDVYVKKARASGYRSRAAFKLLEINEKYRLIRPGMNIADLGAAPGGWCQVARELLGQQGKVMGIDLLEMDALPQVHFIQGDIRDAAAIAALLAPLKDGEVDLVLSDMAPNLTGIVSADQAAVADLARSVVEVCDGLLRAGGHCLFKAFHGEGFDEVRTIFAEGFQQVSVVKPSASRSHSRENYVLARNFRPGSGSKPLQ